MLSNKILSKHTEGKPETFNLKSITANANVAYIAMRKEGD